MPDVALVTYRSEFRAGGHVEHGNRSSLWRRAPDGWVLEFHPGHAASPGLNRAGARRGASATIEGT